MRPRKPSINPWDVLDELGWDDWALPKDTANALLLRLTQRGIDDSPADLILECGSGNSTVCIAAWCLWQGRGEVIALEHEEECAARTRAALYRLGESWGASRDEVDSVATVLHTPLRATEDSRYEYTWYDVDLRGALQSRDCDDASGFDFILVDGPPGSVGRYGALPELIGADALAPGWELWLDDHQRPHEQAVLAAWQERLGVEQYVQSPAQNICPVTRAVRNTGRGIGILRHAPRGPDT